MLLAITFAELIPILVIGFIFLVVFQSVLRGRKLLKDTWPDQQPGWPRHDLDSQDEEPTVLRRYERPQHAPPPLNVPPPLAPSRPAGKSAWELEIERMLRGETAAPPPHQPATPPLPPVQRAPTAEARPPVFRRNYDESTEVESAPAPSAPLAEMSQYALARQQVDAAFKEAASLQQRVRARMQAVDAQTTGHTAPVATAGKTAVQEASAVAVRQWLRQPDTARAAFLASAVFAKPKALEG